MPAPRPAPIVISDRASAILDAAAELLLRHGYKKVTMQDIAQKAGVGVGTVYLHWRNKVDLFESLFMRETLGLWDEIEQYIQTNTQDFSISNMMSDLNAEISRRPLMRALFRRETDLLGKISDHIMGKYGDSAMQTAQLMGMMRDLGLIRQDIPLDVQAHAWRAAWVGFAYVDKFLFPGEKVSAEVQAQAVKQLFRTFEPDVPPSSEQLEQVILPQLLGMFNMLREYYGQELREKMVEFQA